MAAPKTEAYRRGRNAGAANRSIDTNPYPSNLGEHGDWRTGHTDGYYDVGWSKPKKTPRAKKAA